MALTADELVDLLEGFTHRMTVRNFHDFESTEKLSDTQMATLVRFLVGERPDQSEPVAGPTPAPARTRTAPEPNDWQERLKQQLPSAVGSDGVPAEPSDGPSGNVGHRTPNGLELDGGEFDGVVLP